MAKKILIEDNQYRRIFEEGKEPLLEMARVGFMGGEYEVYVHTDDGGYIPHVHVRDKATRGHQFETCIELRRSRYFLHGKYKSIMTRAMVKEFAEFMESKSRNPKFQNNYEYAVDMWNDNNSVEEMIPQYDNEGKIIVPNYRTIIPNK